MSKKKRNTGRTNGRHHGRVTAPGTRPSAGRSVSSVVLGDARAVLFRHDLHEAEQWSSAMQGVIRANGDRPPVSSSDELLSAAERAGDGTGALIAKAIAVYGPLEDRAEADRVFEVIRSKRSIPGWIDNLGEIEIGEVVRVSDPFDDGFAIYLGYRTGSLDSSVGVYIDSNLGSIVKDVNHGAPIEEIHRVAADEDHVSADSMDPAIARAYVEAGFAVLDSRPDITVEDDVTILRPLIQEYFRRLPSGGVAPAKRLLSTSERSALIDAFLGSPWSDDGSEHARVIAGAICTFADSHDGDPLRWSPTVVEMFLHGWLPTANLDGAQRQAAPSTLRAWIAYAGHRNGLPQDLVKLTLDAIDQWVQSES